ncbi:MAG: helix-turn-helix domain-containing protein [Clostridia bacterium]
MNFWERLDSEIEKRSTRKEIAERAGIAASTISMWKKRNSLPIADTAVKLAQALGVSVEYLVTGQHPSGSLSGEMLQLARDIASLPQDDIDELKAIVALKKEKHRGAKAKASAS